MTITKTGLSLLADEITALVQNTESGTGYIYYGTKKGEVWKYNILTGARTLLITLSGMVLSMALYSSKLWIGLSGTGPGQNFVSVSTS
jgi:hypothetical protein